MSVVPASIRTVTFDTSRTSRNAYVPRGTHHAAPAVLASSTASWNTAVSSVRPSAMAPILRTSKICSAAEDAIGAVAAPFELSPPKLHPGSGASSRANAASDRPGRATSAP